jgi:hypothetical protein
MKTKKSILMFTFILLLLTLPAFCDTTSQNVLRNRIELDYSLFNGIQASYFHLVFPHVSLDVFAGYNYTPPTKYFSDTRNEYRFGFGIQHCIRQFGIWDISMLYSLRERLLYYHYFHAFPEAMPIEYGTGLEINPKLHLHIFKGFYSYLSIGLLFENVIYKDNFSNGYAFLAPTYNISNNFSADYQVGIGTNF